MRAYHLVVQRKWWTLQEMAQELSGKVCEIEDAPAGFISDVWKHSGLPASRNKKGENNMQTLPDYNIVA